MGSNGFKRGSYSLILKDLTSDSSRMDPLLDPLRDHPRFQALLDRYMDDVEH